MSKDVKVIESTSKVRKKRRISRKHENNENTSTIMDEARTQIHNVADVLNSPNTVYSQAGHSTPIRNSDNSHLDESSDFGTPLLLPCTQDGCNEVAWDWHSPIAKPSENRTKNYKALNATPKRSSTVEKRRIVKPNSPLFYNPTRLLIKTHNTEGIGKFAAELKALRDQINMGQKAVDELPIPETNEENETSSQLLIDMDTQDLEDLDIKLQVTNEEEKSVLQKENAQTNSSYEELFDDSIEDCMVRCSQEVEERFKLDMNKETASNAVTFSATKEKEQAHAHSMSRLITSATQQPSTSQATSIKEPITNRVMTGILKDSCINNNNNSNHSSNTLFNKNAIADKDDILFSQIPDDSFDDCLVSCLEEEEQFLYQALEDKKIHINADESHNRYGKVYKNNHIVTPKPNIVSKQSTFVPKATVLSSRNTNNNSNISANTSLYKTGSSSNLMNSSHSKSISKLLNTSNEDRKFFKMKSLSEPHFADQKQFSNVSDKLESSSNLKKGPKASSNLNLSSNCWNTVSNSGAGSSTSSKSCGIQSLKSGEANKLPIVNGNTNTNNIYPLNRLVPKGDDVYTFKGGSPRFGCDSKKTFGGSEPVLCTPEEIEQKRLEAKMKLEAKRRMQANAKKSEIPIGVPFKRPVKR
ncbi:bromodomain-containing protein DDB_G0270170 isoform X2 [Cephus cinctus]|nr:bromodomain-containing protein DDB_G0270170 isoform X2 [Cephus cinctus]